MRRRSRRILTRASGFLAHGASEPSWVHSAMNLRDVLPV